LNAGPGARRYSIMGPASANLHKMRNTRCEQMFSAVPPINGHQQARTSCLKSAPGDINCRDCDVRSLAEPEPNRQVFVKFKHLLRKAAARSAETICVIIGEIL
jgi:hypothetical protein